MPAQPTNAVGMDIAFWQELDRVLRALKNLLERGQIPHLDAIDGYRPILLVSMHATKTTYEAISFLSADSPPDPLRKLEYGVVTAPLIRFLADVLVNIIFIALNPKPYTKRYHEAGWRELKEALDGLRKRRGNSRNWAATILRREKQLERLRVNFHISKSKKKDSKRIKYWPYTSQILKHPKVPPRTKKFLALLEDWFYKELSQDSHMSSAGAARLYSKLLLTEEEGRETEFARVKSINIVMAVALTLAICTELNKIGRFDRHNRLSYLWGIMIQNREESRDLYNLRYRRMLEIGSR